MNNIEIYDRLDVLEAEYDSNRNALLSLLKPTEGPTTKPKTRKVIKKLSKLIGTDPLVDETTFTWDNNFFTCNLKYMYTEYTSLRNTKEFLWSGTIEVDIDGVLGIRVRRKLLDICRKHELNLCCYETPVKY
jgi:hypothetical protein